MPGKGGDKSGQGAFKLLFYQIVNFRCLCRVLGNQRSNRSVFIFQYATLAQTLDDRIGSCPLPSELLLTELCQLHRGDRLMLPHNQAKTIFAFVYLRSFHILSLLVYWIRPSASLPR